MTQPSSNDDKDDEIILKIVTIITLGIIVLACIVALTIVAIMTDRNLARAEALTGGVVLILATLGGLSWFKFRRKRHWHVRVDREDKEDE